MVPSSGSATGWEKALAAAGVGGDQIPVQPRTGEFLSQVKQNIDSRKATQPYPQGSLGVEPRDVPPQPAQEEPKDSVPVSANPEDEFVPEVTEPKSEDSPEDKNTSESKDDDEELPEDPNAENFKKLRAKIREYKTDNKEKTQTLAQLQEELEGYKTGKHTPEVIEEYENRISQLSQYEKLHALKMSPEYKKKYIEPIEGISNKLKEIGKDYGVPEHVIEQARHIENRAELNRFLSSHFDELGAGEVKQLIKNLNDIQAEAHEAEQEPAKRLQALQQEFEEIKQIQDTKRKSAIAGRSRDAWGSALMRIKQEGKVKELIFQEGNSEYNDKRVKPIMQAASREYGRMIREMAEGGLEELNPKLAEALAMSVLLGHASAVSIEAREAAINHASELESAMERRQKYHRPSVGGFGGGSSGAAGRQPGAVRTPGESAKSIVGQILGKS